MISKGAVVFCLVLGLMTCLAQGKRRKQQTFTLQHNGTKHSVHNIDLEGEKGQTALSAVANEFVHGFHEPIFLINQAIQNADESPEFKKELISISKDATDLAFAIQKEIHGDPRQLAFQIKSGIAFLTALLPEVTQQAENNEKLVYASSLLTEATDSVLFAIQKLEARTNLNDKTNDELTAIVQETFAKLFVLLNDTKDEDADAGYELHIQLHQLNHILDKTVNKLEVWLHANTIENENSKIIEDVAQHLGTISADLRNAISTKLTVAQLKEKLTEVLKASGQEIRKLEQIETNAGQANEEHAKDLRRDILYDGIAIAKTFDIKLRLILKIDHNEKKVADNLV